MPTLGLALGFLLGAPVPMVWRNYDEVFDLALDDGAVVAATNGGLVRWDGESISTVTSPAGLRAIEDVDPLMVVRASGAIDILRPPKPDRNGATRSEILSSPRTDIDKGVQVPPEVGWLVGQPELLAKNPIPPPGHVYSMIRFGGGLIVGTSDGMYRSRSGKWERIPLPSSLPVMRPNGIAEIDGTYIVGGIGGLYIGKPNQWEKIDGDPVKQVVSVGSAAWVVRGSGALDKISQRQGRFYADVLTGQSKRPWTSCIAVEGDTLLLGGQGGWSEHSTKFEDRYPAQLGYDVVNAIAGDKEGRWVGTQKSGLWLFGAGPVMSWNPGNGLADTWVSALQSSDAGLLIGTNEKGLFLLSHLLVKPFSGPTNRVTCLAEWQGKTVVGGMDGAWIERDGNWQKLDTGGEETTAIAKLDGRLAIVTASGIHFL